MMKHGRPYGFPRPASPAPGRLLLRRRRRRDHGPRASSRTTSMPASTPASSISGINAEVMPGQWEFQVGPAGPLDVATSCGWPAGCSTGSAEDYGVVATLDAKPDEGRLERRRRPHQLLDQGHARGGRLPVHRERPARRSARRSSCTSTNYGHGIEEPPHRQARDGTVEQVQLRRVRPRRLDPHPVAGRQGRQGLPRGPPPNANMDPYVVARLMVETVCSAMS